MDAGDSSYAIEYLKNSYDRYLGESFEQVSKEMLIELNVHGKLPFRFKSIGRQWGKIPNIPKVINDYEIDLVSLNPEAKNILFSECKWQKQKINADVHFSLKEKVAHAKCFPERKEYFSPISKSVFTKNLHEIAKQENVLLLTLQNYLSDFTVERITKSII
ncbi:DUF234 domain-containing protein [Methanolobus vulcani]|uniref:DUF234 domain-containing protein n=1 Tax=Methanolobus vulcani TaxID=38026 RepID=A0A7Z8KRK6_9EURY|nr:DUF234 domain-containing protein [Methanolobus vulcani]TQD26103.1 DUF234 domain-containing protein [Methanolobus vulcani]